MTPTNQPNDNLPADDPQRKYIADMQQNAYHQPESDKQKIRQSLNGFSTPDTSLGDELDDILRRLYRAGASRTTGIAEAKDRLNRLMLTRERAALEKLKQYNGAYIGIGGKRVDNMVHHQVIDEAIAVIDAQLNKEETDGDVPTHSKPSKP